VGRVAPAKGLDLLVDAAAAAGAGRCEVHLFGAARNPRDEAYRRGVIDGAAGRVRVVDHGLLPPERMGEAYGAVDVVVVPSRVPEAFGLVVAESFAAGRPVVVFASGALAELVRDGVDGLVVGECSAGALAAVLRRLVETPGLAGELARGVAPGLTVAGHVDRLERVYGELARG
jgi:glycosyltransferase involved in cell wall biosynthesis